MYSSMNNAQIHRELIHHRSQTLSRNITIAMYDLVEPTLHLLPQLLPYAPWTHDLFHSRPRPPHQATPQCQLSSKWQFRHPPPRDSDLRHPLQPAQSPRISRSEIYGSVCDPMWRTPMWSPEVMHANHKIIKSEWQSDLPLHDRDATVIWK